jgi:NitT/TauT family transport system permease protein
MPFRGQIFTADGLGEKISVAAGTSGASPNYPLQAASVLVMATIVVVFNRLVWRRLYNLASTTYSLNK